MTAKQLSIMLSELGGEEVVIHSACSTIESIGIGFDWDEGKIFLNPSKELVDKNL